MKKILRVLLIIGPCLFFFIKDVNAESEAMMLPSVTYNPVFGSYIDGTVYYKDFNTNNIYWNTTYISGVGGGPAIGYNWRSFKVRDGFTSSSKGIGLTSCSNAFIKDNYYSLILYYVVKDNTFFVHNSYVDSKNHFVGLGSTETIALNNMDIPIIQQFSGVHNDLIYDNKYVSLNAVTFKASKDATCIAWPVNKNGGGLTSSNFEYVGYRLSYQGTEPPSNSELTSLITQESAIINSNIDSMKEKQDKTNELIESEDDDTTSKKCGMLCKLKGIFTGIIELPGKLVNLLIDALKSLFVPTDDQLYDIVNESKELTENFGFVGEAVNFFLTIFTSLLGLVNANGCVELPEFTIGATSLFESHTFWQAQNVCLGDNAILSANINTIRTITSIVLVSLFINFAARKFFNILSKNDNDQARTDAYDIK